MESNTVRKSSLFTRLSFLLVFFFGFSLTANAGAFDAWSHQKVINLSGTGSTEANYIIPLNIHYGAQQGDNTATDIYLGGNSKTDFSDFDLESASYPCVPKHISLTTSGVVKP